MLINAARRFPKTAMLWEEAEDTAANIKVFSTKNIREVPSAGNSRTCPSFGSVLIVFLYHICSNHSNNNWNTYHGSDQQPT